MNNEVKHTDPEIVLFEINIRRYSCAVWGFFCCCYLFFCDKSKRFCV